MAFSEIKFEVLTAGNHGSEKENESDTTDELHESAVEKEHVGVSVLRAGIDPKRARKRAVKIGFLREQSEACGRESRCSFKEALGERHA